MLSVSQQLRALFQPEQVDALDRVRQAMLADPTILDNHSREKRDGKEVQDPNGKVGSGGCR